MLKSLFNALTVAVAAAVVLAGCATPAPPPPPVAKITIPAPPPPPPRPPAAAVASAHPLATAAGLDIIAAGGNAFDAAVAVAAVLAVVEPYSSGLGGGSFWMLHREVDNFDVFVDGREVGPIAATGDVYLKQDGTPDAELSHNGPLGSGIPGHPAALAHVSERYGRLPLAQVLQPALVLAREGFAVDAQLAAHVAENWPRFSASARAVFGAGGVPVAEGEWLRQAALAGTLQRLAQSGAPGFYRGDVAQRLYKSVFDGGGIWSTEDLRTYQVVERQPMTVFHHGARLTLPPLPSACGIGLTAMLGTLERLGWPHVDPIVAKHQLIEVARRAYVDRFRYLGDPAFEAVPVAQLLAPAYFQQLAMSIDPVRMTPRATLAAVRFAPPTGLATTHVSVVDTDGNRAAVTASINTSFGAAFVAGDTGVVLNNEMEDFDTAPLRMGDRGKLEIKPNAIAPGKRMLSSMCPLFAESHGRVAVMGTPGGTRIITMMLDAVQRFAAGAPATDIVGAPRFHHQFEPDELYYEPAALTPVEVQALQLMGHTLQPAAKPYGNMQVVIWNRAETAMEAASDPRGTGAAVIRTSPPAAPEPGRAQVAEAGSPTARP